MNAPRRVTLLGATGSIGASAVDVLAAHPDAFEIVALVAGSDAPALATLARRLGARFAALADPAGGRALAEALAGSGIGCGAGESAVAEAVALPTDLVVAGISGTAGLKPTHAALQPGRIVALANKECLVCAGDAFLRDAARLGATIRPLDSEHNALLQALGDAPIAAVERMTLTASGGPFRTWSARDIASATPEQALAHPKWSMGRKISVDSATLMNKGLELIEAHHLFGLPAERLDVLVHPEALVHGLVHFVDGAVTAGLAMPDMRVAMAHCLRGEERLSVPTPRIDLATVGSLTFTAPDETRFPALRLAREALRSGGALPTVLNAANEIAVAAFLDRRIGILGIADLVAATLEAYDGPMAAPASVAEALAVDHDVKQRARRLLSAWGGAANDKSVRVVNDR